jgi:hypothetical protein
MPRTVFRVIFPCYKQITATRLVLVRNSGFQSSIHYPSRPSRPFDRLRDHRLRNHRLRKYLSSQIFGVAVAPSPSRPFTPFYCPSRPSRPHRPLVHAPCPMLHAPCPMLHAKVPPPGTWPRARSWLASHVEWLSRNRRNRPD